MVAGFVQQREDKRIFVDEGMARQPAIKTHHALAADSEGLRVDDARLRFDLIVDAGERVAKFADKHIQRSHARLRAAKDNVIWQGEGVEHFGDRLLLSHLQRLWGGTMAEFSAAINQARVAIAAC